MLSYEHFFVTSPTERCERKGGKNSCTWSTQWVKSILFAALYTGWVALCFIEFSFFSPPLILLIFILALWHADVRCSSTEARNTFLVLLQNHLTLFYFILLPNWTRLNDSQKCFKWNITFSEMGEVFFFSHLNWALRATCCCLRGAKVVSRILRSALSSSSLILREWKWVWLFCSLNPPKVM